MTMWGSHKENGFWRASSKRFKATLFRNDTLVYIALGRLRFRLMKTSLCFMHGLTENDPGSITITDKGRKAIGHAE